VMSAAPSPEAAVEKVWGLENAARLPSLSEFGVQKKDFQKIAEMALQHPCTLSNPRVPTASDYVGILNKASNQIDPLA
jgi:alcohol dehydrogenase class IV